MLNPFFYCSIQGRKRGRSREDDEAEAEWEDNKVEEEEEEPDIVQSYSNSSRSYQPVKLVQIGLNGLKQEILRVQGIAVFFN